MALKEPGQKRNISNTLLIAAAAAPVFNLARGGIPKFGNLHVEPWRQRHPELVASSFCRLAELLDHLKQLLVRMKTDSIENLRKPVQQTNLSRFSMLQL